MKNINKFLFILILIEIIISSYIAYSDFSGTIGKCITGTQCNDVQNSVYGQIFGIKVSLLGLIAFIILLIVFMLDQSRKIPRYVLPILMLIGTLVALCFIALQLFVLKQICTNCFIIDFIMIIISITYAFSLKSIDKNKRPWSTD